MSSSTSGNDAPQLVSHQAGVELSPSALAAARRPRVLIISYYFPPDLQVAAERPAHFAKYLTRLGWEVWVLTIATASCPEIDLDFTLDFMDPERVIRIATSRESPATVTPTVMPTSSASGSDNLTSRMKGYLANAIAMRRSEIKWISPAIKAGQQLIDEQGIDVLLSICSPFASHLVATQLQKKTRRPWLADFTVPWAANPLWGSQGAWQRFLRSDLENWALRQASCISVANESIRALFLAQIRKRTYPRIEIVSYSYDPEEFCAAADIGKLRNDQRMTITNAAALTSREALTLFLDAVVWARMQKYLVADQVEVRFIGIEEMGKGPTLREMIAARQLETIVRPIGAVPRKELAAHELASDILLYLQTPKPGANLFASSRLYAYLGAGRYILMVSHPSAGTEFLQQASGVTVVAPTSVAEIGMVLGGLFNRWREGKLEAGSRAALLAAIQEPEPTRKLAELLQQLIECQT
jgi:hypothetical protein